MIFFFMLLMPSLDSFAQTYTVEQLLKTGDQRYAANHSQHDLKSGIRDERPNILFIMLDDARADFMQANGGQSFFPTPNIDRIANEGVNFKICTAVLPLCTPSRGTFFTGKFSHKTGVKTNPDVIQGGLPWISSILQASGYSTYIAGKLGFPEDSIKGFDEYLLSTNDKYINARFTYFGPSSDTILSNIHIPGHTTDIVTNFASDFIRRHSQDDHPFFVFVPHRAPHVPLIPRPEDKGIFDNDTMPYPDNAYKYDHNYPSYLYPYNQAGTPEVQDSFYRGYFELLAGVEATTGELLDTLQYYGLLDNTVVMFTSDNGNLKSEHLLQGKQLPYDESLKIPMFIRYPEWFQPGTIVDDVIASNIDWAPTLLDIAELPDIYGMDGVSLRKIASHEVPRHEILYEVWHENETPAMRGVRTMQYKYIYSFCDDTTEQFFDLVNDPEENTNLINDPAYKIIIQYYRCKLDSMRTATGDILNDTILNCKLKGRDSSHVGASLNPGPLGPCIFPVFDGDSTFEVVGIDEPGANNGVYCDVTFYNLMGQEVYHEKRIYHFPIADDQIYTGNIPPGFYLVTFENGSMRKSRKIMIQ